VDVSVDGDGDGDVAVNDVGMSGAAATRFLCLAFANFSSGWRCSRNCVGDSPTATSPSPSVAVAVAVNVHVNVNVK